MISYPARFITANLRRRFNMPSDPFLLNYSLTFRCNLDCKYCGVSRLKNNYSQEELGCKDISDFLSDKALRNLDVVVVTGGEPFLKEDLVQILLEFKKKTQASIIHVTTNGFLTDKIVDAVSFLVSRGLVIDLKISIDDIGEGHDILRGRTGSFRTAIRTMERLRSLIRNEGMFLGINQTVYADNFESIPEVKKMAAEFGAEYLGFVGLKNRPLFSDSSGCDFSLVDLDQEARDFVVKELGDCLRRHNFSGGLSNFLETLIIGHYVRGQIDLLRNRSIRHRCMNLFTHFRLNPNGDMMTCSYDTEVLGNIRSESYSEIMAKQTTKNKLGKVKGCGKCWLGCEVSPSWVSSLCLG